MPKDIDTGVEIRHAGERDLRDVARFLEKESDQFPIPLADKVDIPEYAEKMLKLGKVLVATAAGEVAGVAGGYANDSVGGRAYLSVIVVDSERRGTGVSGDLLERFEEAARFEGMLFCSLETHETNARALAFYRKRGYAIEGPAKAEDNLSLKKRLAWLTPARPNVLLTSAGRRTYLVEWFKEALGGHGEVLAVNSDPKSPAMLAADFSERSPLIYSEEYVPFLLDFCNRHRVGAVIPLFDIDIPVLAAHRSEFVRAGVFPVVAPEGFARACADKLATAQLLASAGILHPETYDGADGFMQAVRCGESAFPAFVKPRWGMGSIGIATASDEAELRAQCAVAERKVAATYLKYESAAEPSRTVVVQPAVNGDEYGMDVICDLDGSYRACVVRRKLAMRAGETDAAEVIEPDGRFVALARRLAEISHHPGNMDVDLFDVEGDLMVLEMNARFGGGYPFSHAAGVDLPAATVSWLRGEECDFADLEAKRFGCYAKDISVVSLNQNRRVVANPIADRNSEDGSRDIEGNARREA